MREKYIVFFANEKRLISISVIEISHTVLGILWKWVSFFVVLAPHLIWLVNNNYTTINYAIFRSVDDPLSGFESAEFLNHILYPIIFLAKQVGKLAPFFIMLYFIVSKFKTKINYKDEKILFLISITLLPIILVFFTSIVLILL